MRFATTLAFTGSIALFFGGCAEEGTETDTTANSMQEQAGDVADQAGDTWEAARDAFIAQTESRVDALEARVAAIEAEESREEAREALETVKEEMARLRDAGADEWESIRDSLADALQNLEAGFRPGS